MDASAQIPGGEDGAGRQALRRHDDRHPLGPKTGTAAPATAAHTKHERDPEADLPGPALVGAGGQAQAASVLDRRRGAEGGPGGAVDIAMGAPVLSC